jgi:hypothetical protein
MIVKDEKRRFGGGRNGEKFNIKDLLFGMERKLEGVYPSIFDLHISFSTGFTDVDIDGRLRCADSCWQIYFVTVQCEF